MTQEIPLEPTSAEQTPAEKEAREYVQKLKAFYVHLITYLATLAFLLVINLMVSPGYLWVKWAALGWGMGIVVHGLAVFEIFGFLDDEWERKQIAKRLNRRSSIR